MKNQCGRTRFIIRRTITMNRTGIRLHLFTRPIMTNSNNNNGNALMKKILNSRISTTTSNITIRVNNCCLIRFSNLGRIYQGRIRLCITHVTFNEKGTITISNSKTRIDAHTPRLPRTYLTLIMLRISTKSTFGNIASIKIKRLTCLINESCVHGPRIIFL